MATLNYTVDTRPRSTPVRETASSLGRVSPCPWPEGGSVTVAYEIANPNTARWVGQAHEETWLAWLCIAFAIPIGLLGLFLLSLPTFFMNPDEPDELGRPVKELAKPPSWAS